MRNATIATSRTRATTDQLIDYRPLPAEWGDLEALHALRAEKSRAAAHGLNASTLEIERVPAERSHRTARPGRLRGLLAPPAPQARRPAPPPPRRRSPRHGLTGHGSGHLATARAAEAGRRRSSGPPRESDSLDGP